MPRIGSPATPSQTRQPLAPRSGEAPCTPATARKRVRAAGKENVTPQKLNISPASSKKRTNRPFGSRRRVTKAAKEAANTKKEEQKMRNIQAAQALNIPPGTEVILRDDDGSGVWKILGYNQSTKRGKYDLKLATHGRNGHADIDAEVLQQRLADGTARLVEKSLKPIPVECRVKVELRDRVGCQHTVMPSIPRAFANGHVFRFTPTDIDFTAIWQKALSQMEDSRPKDVDLGPHNIPRTMACLPGDNIWYRMTFAGTSFTEGDELEPLGGGAASFMDKYTEACRRGASRCTLEWTHVWLIYRYARSVCFGGEGFVALSGGAFKRVDALRAGDAVVDASGEEAQVLGVWRTAEHGRALEMVAVEGVWLTPDHPILVGGEWVRPDSVEAATLRSVDFLYNVALSSRAGIAIAATGSPRAAQVRCCTLGQPVPGFPEPFWGSQMVIEYMQAQPGWPHIGGQHDSAALPAAVPAACVR